MMNWKYTVWNDDVGLFKVVSWYFPGRTEENHEKPQSGWLVCRYFTLNPFIRFECIKIMKKISAPWKSYT
jgi:IMP cyclohydrolase